jgi:hypothetical protein
MSVTAPQWQRQRPWSLLMISILLLIFSEAASGEDQGHDQDHDQE